MLSATIKTIFGRHAGVCVIEGAAVAATASAARPVTAVRKRLRRVKSTSWHSPLCACSQRSLRPRPGSVNRHSSDWLPLGDDGSFNEAHILAIAQAVCLYRHRAGIDGPLFVGTDTHALSEPAFSSALEVLSAN